MIFLIVKFIIFLPIKIFFPTFFIGRKNIPKGRAVLVSNHYSNVDAFIFAVNLTRKRYYLAKKELFKTKFGNWLFRGLRAIPIDREKPDVTAIKESLKVLKNEYNLFIFPEGTRNKTNTTDLQEIKSGCALFALKTNSPIVPIHIKKRPRVFCFNKVVIGKPFYLEGFEGRKLDKETLEEASKIITEKMNENANYFNKQKTQK